MKDYEEILNIVTKNVQKRIAGSGNSKVKGTDFEKIVYEELVKAGVDENKITHYTQKFPDFIISDDDTKIGVEVKKTDSDKWDVPGGSVFESLRNDIETYVLMGKYGGVPEARIRKYKDCISGMTVTHSPRFHLKLDMECGEDYLSRNNAFDLLDLPEGEELYARIRELLRTDRNTWYTQKTTKPYSELKANEKMNYFVDGVVLFPAVVGGDYSKFAPWMIYKCLIWCKNIRDVFSAGGMKEFDDFKASAVMARILDRTDLIVERISKMTINEIKEHWNVEEDIPLEKRVDKWMELVKKNITVSPILIKGNKEKHPNLINDASKEDYSTIIRDKFMIELNKKMKESVQDFKSNGDKT